MNSDIVNRLINETSPYLLQHAHNPVDWYPWGEEAFEKAKAEDKPVFLSIGYSTCHWCHVMAHESFEDAEVARVLNTSFVSVKVDREERPDIDEVYMNVCQAITGSGGWPLTVIMTADKVPFYAGTYLPKNTAYGRMGLMELLAKVIVMWQKDKDSLTKHSEKLDTFFNQQEETLTDTVDETKTLQKAYASIENAFDSEFGGFSYAPKFPTPHYLLFLLNYSKAYDNADALMMVEKTLDAMYRGGIFDHVEYGFSRYATDNKWLVPHFEKMLYDNAMLLLAYCQAYAVTRQQEYRDVADKTADYMLNGMRSPRGAFYSAEDADSEGEEGKYYVFDYSDLEKEFDDDELRFLEARYGLEKYGNFEGKTILNMIDAHIEETGIEEDVLKKLLAIRKKRVRPFRDEKILASWNGLAIEAFAYAGMVMGEVRHIESAKQAADFILNEMTDENGALIGVYKDGKRAKAFLADYANISNALLTLYTATLDIAYLQKARSFTNDMIRLFWEESENRFYMTKKEDEALFMRPRDDYDGAMPSGNAAAAMCMIRLYHLTGDEDIKETLDRAMAAFTPKADVSPGAHVHYLSALMKYVMPPRQVVIAADKQAREAHDAYQTVVRQFLPFTTIIYYDKSAEMDAMFPELGQYKTDKPFAAYVCENFVCRQPVYTPRELMEELGIQPN